MGNILRIGLQPVADRQWMGGVNYIVNIACALKKAMGAQVSINLCLTRSALWKILPLYAGAFPVIDRIFTLGFRPADGESPRPLQYCPDSLDLYNHIDFLYPGMYNFSEMLLANYPSAGWLADFQHMYLPEFFTKQELAFRDTQERQILSAGGPVFFSSQSALEDARKFYPEYNPPMRVLHFHTSADNDWYRLDPAAVRAQHGLPAEYFICCNQFWMHKNHGVLFEALKLLKGQGQEVFLVCTGDTRDNRSTDYFPKLQQLLVNAGVQAQVRFLGVIPRAEQIALVRGSLAVLQPSRFEGWSTVVEDSRLLGKTIFLSNIPVHCEQNPEHGIFFEPKDAHDLAQKLLDNLSSLKPGPAIEREERARREGEALVLDFGRNFYELAREACCLLPSPFGLPADLPVLRAPFSGIDGIEEEGVTVVTALRNDQATERAAVASWLKAGFQVLSCNSPEDAERLRQSYPQVKFVDAGRRGLNVFKLQGARIGGMLRAAGLQRRSVVGIIKPDVQVRDPEALRRLLLQEERGKAVLLQSMKVLDAKGTAGLIEPQIIDAIFLPRTEALGFEQTEFQLGAPWWECWLTLRLLAGGLEMVAAAGLVCRVAGNRALDPAQSDTGLKLLRRVLRYAGISDNPAIPAELRTLLNRALPATVLAEKFGGELCKHVNQLGPAFGEREKLARAYILELKEALFQEVKSTPENRLMEFVQRQQDAFAQIREYEKQHGWIEPAEATQAQTLQRLRLRRKWSGKELLTAALRLPALHLPSELWPQGKELREVLPFFLQYVFQGGWALTERGETDLLPATLAAGYECLHHFIAGGGELSPAIMEGCFNNEYVLLAYAANAPLRLLMEWRGKMTLEFNRRKLHIEDWHPHPRTERPRIRLGVFLKVFQAHTETYATIPFFCGLDRSRFEVRLYALHQSNSELERHCLEHAESLTVLQGSIDAHLRQLRAENLDLLLIGTNATAVLNDAVFFGLHRAARKQLVQFCQPYTTGLPCIDGFIAGDDLGLAANDFSEQLHLISGSGICFSPGLPEKDSPLEITRQTRGIPRNDTVFISGANYFKIRVELLDAWTNLLAQTPDTTLVLLPFGPAWSNNYPEEKFESLLRQSCAKNGIARERVVISPPLPSRSDVRRLIALCDIYLDSFPYSGATSLLDPFTLHMPVVAMETHTVCGGQGAGMLLECGLRELVAKDEVEYLRIARRLVEDTEYRTGICARIAEIMEAGAPFHDLNGFIQKVQPIYEAVCREET